MSALDDFRADPEQACEKYDFLANARGFTNMNLPGVTNCQYGGPCTLTETSVTNGVVCLSVKNGGNDYLFPWVNRGVGEVKVPKGAANGTVVVTGGMNGCSLVVTDIGSHFLFYHDADSCQLGVRKAAEGTEVCRIGTESYMPTESGAKIVGQTLGDGSVYLHQLLVVKHDDRWKAFSFGIIVGPGLDPVPKQSFRDGISKFVTTFE